MWGVMGAGAESLSLFCRSLTGRAMVAGWPRPARDSAGWEELFVSLSWTSPVSQSDKATESRCSSSLSTSCPAEGACWGEFYNWVELEQVSGVAQFLE